jgi:Domain of unknown function (DUF4390)
VLDMSSKLTFLLRTLGQVGGSFALIALLSLSMVNAFANEGIEIGDTRLERSIDGEAWILNVDVDIQLNLRLEDAVNKGLPLYFVLELEISKPRWYWFDESSANKSQSYKLSYHALTRQYRLSLGAYQQTFSSLADALRAMTKVRGWRVGEFEQFTVGAKYEAQVRMRLDVSQLPKPFQVIGITNKEWTLASDWKRFVFIPRAPVQ